MKAILFDEKFGLRSAVLSGRKTMTRRLMKPQPTWVSADGKIYNDSKPSRYKVGEVVAVAQPYETFMSVHELCERGLYTSAGAHNSMFIKPLLMPHQIQITDIKVERLHDITEEDCLKEGVWIDSHREVLDDNIYTVDVFLKHYCQWHFPSAREAFSFLIDKVSGKGSWERNPWVFAYSFKLVK